MVVTFRQNSVARFEVAIFTHTGVLVAQPDGFPTLEAIFVDPDTGRVHTAISATEMFELEPGRHFLEWRVPFDQPLLVHQVIHRGFIDEEPVLGEDVFTVLPITPTCLRSPTILTKIKGGCGCRS